jgi:VWFA-related protein
MFPNTCKVNFTRFLRLTMLTLVTWLALVPAIGLASQTGQTGTSSSSKQGQSQQTQQNQQQKPAQQAPAEAGGPQGDIGPIAVPKKKPEEEKPVEKQPKIKNPEEIGNYSLRVDVPLVNVDVSVVTKDGQFIPGLKRGNFRIYEDGVPQKVADFSQSEKPITAVLLVEFAATNYYFVYDMLNSAYTFAQSLKAEDYVAVISYDMKSQIVADFTQDKRQVYAALNSLRIPGFSETNLFDALYDTIDRLEGVEGHKYIILVSSGYDSFSKLTYDKALKKVQGSHDITIYAIGTGQAVREYYDSHGYMSPLARLDYLQADNQMNTFARLTGGHAWFPRFEGDLPEIFHDINASIRNQYTLAYHPSNPKQDGTWRKLKVEVVDETGAPLKVQDQHKKAVKYQVLARDGYRAKQEVE